MTDRDLVLRKLGLLRMQLARVARRIALVAEGTAEEDRIDALSMSLLAALQEGIDIAFHIVTDDGVGVPASNAESFDLLARHGVIPLELAGALAAAAGMRNRLAHGYGSVDPARLLAELPGGIRVLDAYVSAVATWLGPGGAIA